MDNLLRKTINEVKGGKFSALFFKKVLRYAVKLISKFAGKLIPLSYVKKGLALKPGSLNLAVTNICNSRCLFCAYQYLSAPQGFMSDEVFKKAIGDFVAIGGGNIGMTPIVGEPLVDPKIMEKIEYCRSFPEIKHIGFTTNGILFKSVDLRRLVKSGINTITISMGGFDREGYKKIFRVDFFDQVREGIVKLCQINNELGRPVEINISLRTFKPIDEIIKEPAYKEINGLVNAIHYQYNFDSWSGRIKQSDLLGLMKLKPLREKTEPCSILYGDGPEVLWNGNVTVCGCRDLNGDSDLVLGNIMEHSLIDLWRGEKLKKLRENWNSKIPNVCRDCSNYNYARNLKTFAWYKKARKNLKAYGK